MKKLFILFVFFAVLSTVAVQAQNYKPFRVGLGLGYASPAGDGAKGGVLAYLEPSYRITDAIVVGLKAEAAVMFRGTTITQSGQTYAGNGSVSAAGSYTLNGQYYFMDGGFRPYAGLGFGIYSLASASVSFAGNGQSQTSSQSEVAAASKFGFYPRVGFDAGHFTLNIEYNIVPKSTTSLQVNNGGSITTATSETKNNYLGIRLGFFIGGGKKK
jgi:outer membrane protein W